MLQLFLLILLCLQMRYFYNGSRFQNLFKQVRGQKGILIVAYGLLVLRNGGSAFKRRLQRMLQHYGNRFYLQLDMQSVCLFTEKPEDIELMLNSPNAIGKDDIYQLAAEPCGLLALSGEKWQDRRTKMEPHFGVNSLEVYVPLFNQHAHHLVASVRTVVGHLFDVKETIGRCTMDTLGATLMGKIIAHKEDAHFRTAFERLTSVFEKRRFQIWLQTRWFFFLTKYRRVFTQSLKVMHTFVQCMMASESDAGKSRTLWIDAVKSQSNSTEEVAAECILTLLLGNEKLALVMSNTVLLLAQHPEIQAKLYAELQQTGDDELTLNNLPHLRYLDHVINETMRLQTIVPVITRKTNGVLKLNDGVVVSEACHLGMLVDAMHHNSKIWGDDAQQFRPERFADDDKLTRHSFVPFGEGPRKCIGQRYAMVAMKVMLAHLLRVFEFSTAVKFDELKWTNGYLPQLVNKHVVEVAVREPTMSNVSN